MIARDKDTCWYIMHSQVRYLQLCDCNVTHVIYVIPLKYFKNSTVILIHAEKIVYWSKRIPNDYHFGNDCPCLRKLPMFSLSSIVTIRIICIGPHVSLHLTIETRFLGLILFLATKNSHMCIGISPKPTWTMAWPPIILRILPHHPQIAWYYLCGLRLLRSYYCSSLATWAPICLKLIKIQK